MAPEITHPLRSPLSSPLSSPLARRRGGGAYNPVNAFGSDLVTWYGNSVEELWRAQAAGGPVTLYQDSAGTTPVTALEQSPGLILDQSQGLELGDPTIDGSFTDSTGWSNIGAGGWSIVSGQLVRSAGEVSTSQVNRTDGVSFAANKWYSVSINVIDVTGEIRVQSNTGQQLFGSGITTPGVKTTIFYNASAVNAQIIGVSAATCIIDDLLIQELPGHHLYQSNSTSRMRLSARFNLLTATDTLSTQSVTTIAASHRLTFAGAGSITLSGTATGTYSAGTHTITATAGSLTLTVSGAVTNADLRLTSYPSIWPQYQRVTNSSDYDTVGFPARLVADGSNDGYLSGAIDLTAISQACIVSCAGKTSDAAEGVLYEFSPTTASNNGSFALRAPGSAATATYVAESKGTNLVSATASSQAAPNQRVITQTLDIANDVLSLRLNGAEVATSASDQGTGNLGNYPLYVGRRNNASLPLRGDYFSLPMIVGRSMTTEEINNAEDAFGKKNGIFP